MYRIPRLRQITPAAAPPGSRITAWLGGNGLEAVTGVHFSGAGVVAHLAAGGPDGRLELAVVVSPDAAAGPRAVELSFQWQGRPRRERQGVRFQVLPRGSHGDFSGIGSHLI